MRVPTRYAAASVAILIGWIACSCGVDVVDAQTQPAELVFGDGGGFTPWHGAENFAIGTQDRAPRRGFTDENELFDVTVSLILSGQKELVSIEREKELINMAISRNPDLLILGKHYENDHEQFVVMSKELEAN